MSLTRTIGLIIFLMSAVTLSRAQQPSTIKVDSADVKPTITNLPLTGGRVTDLHLRPFFITTIRLPEPATSVAVGDKTLFDAEHSTGRASAGICQTEDKRSRKEQSRDSAPVRPGDQHPIDLRGQRSKYSYRFSGQLPAARELPDRFNGCSGT